MKRKIVEILGEARLNKDIKPTLEGQIDIILSVRDEMAVQIKNILDLKVKEMAAYDFFDHTSFFLNYLTPLYTKATEAYTKSIEIIDELHDFDTDYKEYSKKEQNIFDLLGIK